VSACHQEKKVYKFRHLVDDFILNINNYSNNNDEGGLHIYLLFKDYIFLLIITI
jgi:hypothetical protein